MPVKLLPLFDSLDNIKDNDAHVCLSFDEFKDDYNQALIFLKSYTGSLGTFNAYRREVERFLHWSWLIKEQSIIRHNYQAIEEYVHFCINPPKSWIGLKKVPRYKLQEGLRKPNPEWRPFVVTLSKAALKKGIEATREQFSLSQTAIKDIFAILSTFYNFLIAQEYVMANPVALIRQKSKFIRKNQGKKQIRRLSPEQWQQVLTAAEQLAATTPEKHERTLFMISALYGMYLRISELTVSERWSPTMNDFYQDSNQCWWFQTVGKGNKERQIAVSDAMLESLKRWRHFLGLSGLPSSADNSPLLPKLKGQGGLSDTAPIRRIIQQCFDLACENLIRQGKTLEAETLTEATVHWLRHTGISDDVKIRPREHVRDDAGHSSSATTDRYIDIELTERHRSAQQKKIDNITD